MPKYEAKYFSNQPLHHCEANVLMQDHHLVALMPKSQGPIVVLPPASPYEQDERAFYQITLKSLSEALRDPKVQHVVLPMGPAHWRAWFFSKGPGATYTLEVFDSQGANHAKNNEHVNYALQQIKQHLQAPRQITYTQPPHLQREEHACGDFVCAYTHKKVSQILGTSDPRFQILVETLDKQGNRNNALRHAAQAVSRGKSPGSSFAKATEKMHPTRQPTAKFQNNNPEQAAYERHALSNEEQSVFDATTAPSYNHKNLAVFQDHISYLLKNKATIFKARDALNKKLSTNLDLDYNMAVRLQAEELECVFKK